MKTNIYLHISGIHGPDLSRCLFVWESTEGDSKKIHQMAVFDMNRWYHAQMPATLRYVTLYIMYMYVIVLVCMWTSFWIKRYGHRTFKYLYSKKSSQNIISNTSSVLIWQLSNTGTKIDLVSFMTVRPKKKYVCLRSHVKKI
jgi:hypothetical protein